jgi:hypothetical protein
MRNVSNKRCRENQSTHFVLNDFFAKTVPFMRKFGKNVMDPERLQMTTWLLVAWRVSKATHAQALSHTHASTPTPKPRYKHTHPHKYVTLTASPQQQWFRERASLLRHTMYIACIVLFQSSMPNILMFVALFFV